jgi:hypothetical protein
MRGIGGIGRNVKMCHRLVHGPRMLADKLWGVSYDKGHNPLTVALLLDMLPLFFPEQVRSFRCT